MRSPRRADQPPATDLSSVSPCRIWHRGPWLHAAARSTRPAGRSETVWYGSRFDVRIRQKPTCHPYRVRRFLTDGVDKVADEVGKAIQKCLCQIIAGPALRDHWREQFPLRSDAR